MHEKTPHGENRHYIHHWKLKVQVHNRNVKDKSIIWLQQQF